MRRVLLLLIAALAASVLVGCGATDAPALTVNGTDVDEDEFQDALEALATEGQGDGTVAITLAPGSTGAGATAVADQFVDVTLIGQELDERGIEPSEDDRRLAEAQLPAETPDLTEAGREQLLDWGEQRIALLRALFEESVQPESLLCLRVILVPDEAEAQAVLLELAAGADFAELSRERSTDPQLAQTGGDLGCQASGFRPELQEAAAGLEIGEIGDPVTLEFGSVIVQRTEPTFESTAATVDAEVLNPLLQALRAEADVEIDPRYGRWDANLTPPAVVGPEGPVAPTTTAAPTQSVPGQPPVAPQTGPPEGG